MRRAQITFGAVACALVLAMSELHATSVYVSKDVDVPFANRAVALSADERTRLAFALDNIRDWCGFELAFITGHADPSEATSNETVALSESRAKYVAQLLRIYGVPQKRVFTEGKGDSQPLQGSFSGRVEIYFKGEGTGERGCSIPRGPGGFRARNL